MKIVINALGNAGYSDDQVEGVKIGDLIEFLQQFEDDDELITYNYSNRYGAPYGKIYLSLKDDEEYY